MLHVTHTTPGRLLSHLGKLVRDGEALLAQPSFLGVREPALWEVRVWRCLEKIASPDAFESASQQDNAEVGPIDLLDDDRPRRSAAELDELLRRRLRRRLVTLSSVMEKVEAMAEAAPRRSRKNP
jgi:hypothetical protein